MTEPPQETPPGETPTATESATHLESPPAHVEAYPTGKRLAALTLLAIGVVYGDIGTSPLYAFRECFKPEYGLQANQANVYGVLSLILWSLILVVSVKYIAFVLQADNRGEGGILSLLALVLQRKHRESERKYRMVVIVLGLIGAALLYGDGIITPAISVLGAMEGISVAAPAFHHLVLPLSLGVIVGLFLVQKRGTAGVGKIFGPVTLLWFIVIATLGAIEIAKEPRTLLALNPWYAVQFFVNHGTGGFIILGAVVLAVTGAEALYADMGHFGKRPIRTAWFAIVFPALLLNYFGQGALVLRDPSAAVNPFYLLAPDFFKYPLIAIATAAAIVASQAMISGAFSLTRQCVQLGYCPRVTIVHTSKTESGQIYIPEVNRALMVGCILIVLGFRTSSALGAAYGIAVTGTFTITTLLMFVLARSWWNWDRVRAGIFVVTFLIIDLSFFGSNVLKVIHGGWVPLLIGAALFLMMTTWFRGRTIVQDMMNRSTLPMDLLIQDVAKRKTPRVPGVAVFMTPASEGAPVVLLHHLKHNKMLHEQVVLLSIVSTEVPEVSDESRLTVEALPEGFFRVISKYGYMETPDVVKVIERLGPWGVHKRPGETSYYLGRERLLPTGTGPLAKWRKNLYIFMSRNTPSAAEFFGIPPNRAVELGAQMEL
ncbi:MAG: potassium transporter Kup [Gemmatimonadaceae bacterium]|nr:potassium transporter Kup [Gemmatimonadaceae bacterium]